MPPGERSPTYTSIFSVATAKGKHFTKLLSAGTSKVCGINPLLPKLADSPARQHVNALVSGALCPVSLHSSLSMHSIPQQGLAWTLRRRVSHQLLLTRQTHWPTSLSLRENTFWHSQLENECPRPLQPRMTEKEADQGACNSSGAPSDSPVQRLLGPCHSHFLSF